MKEGGELGRNWKALEIVPILAYGTIYSAFLAYWSQMSHNQKGGWFIYPFKWEFLLKKGAKWSKVEIVKVHYYRKVIFWRKRLCLWVAMKTQ